MKNYISDNGLLLDKTTLPHTVCGYIFNFPGHGCFSPGTRVMVEDETYLGKTREATSEEIKTHNRLLGEMELASLKKEGKGVLYLSEENGKHSVATWSGIGRVSCHHARKSWHNMAGRDGRTDVWFSMDGSLWHGVNIGDSQICRVKRCKGKR